jgi:hypothetical protein
MAGLGPAIHVWLPHRDVDARDKPAHDERTNERNSSSSICERNIQIDYFVTAITAAPAFSRQAFVIVGDPGTKLTETV